MISIALLTYLADREIKNSVNATRALGSREEVLGGKVCIRNVHNSITPAHRLGLGQEKAEKLSRFTILMPVLYYVLTHVGRKGFLSRLSSSLMLGGALGNWVERLEYGYATDYLQIKVGPKKLQKIIFNLADIAIVLGGILGFLALLLPSRDR